MTHKITQPLKWAAIALAALTASASIQTSATADDFYVVVNNSNGYSADIADMKTQIRRFYLKESKNWPGGSTVVSFSRKPSHVAYHAMLNGLLKMSPSEFEEHWARKKQTTGDTRPRSVGSTNILLRLIKRTPGAIGIIKKADSTSLPDGVKVLFEFAS
ncbi:MAG: hypothetical protein JKY60_08375 [Kordiimonadaceae bacterium]|nr:hypothetical protein [Kordiimonadaceae bacterium]